MIHSLPDKSLFQRRNLALQLRDSCTCPNLGVAFLDVLHLRSQQVADVVVAAKTCLREGRIAFAQCEHICTTGNQELSNVGVAIHAGNVERSISKITSFVYVYTSNNEGPGRIEVALAHNPMQCVVTFRARCVHIRKINF